MYFQTSVSVNINLFNVNNRNFRKMCEICSKLTIQITERPKLCRSGVFIVKFEHILYLLNIFLELFFFLLNFEWRIILLVLIFRLIRQKIATALLKVFGFREYVGKWFLLNSDSIRLVKVLNYGFTFVFNVSLLAFTCSKSTIESLEKGVKYVQS